MLLRNESRVKHSIMIKLVYDDNYVCELELQEGDFVQVSYRKNGCIKNAVGVIKKIKHFGFFKCRDNATITLDMSTDLEAHIDTIELHDIIKIRHIEPIDFKCCCCCKVEKPSVPEDENTNEGEIAGE